MDITLVNLIKQTTKEVEWHHISISKQQNIVTVLFYTYVITTTNSTPNTRFKCLVFINYQLTKNYKDDKLKPKLTDLILISGLRLNVKKEKVTLM